MNCTEIENISGPRSVPNLRTNRTSQEIAEELERGGYNKTSTRDGGARYEKGDKVYNFYPNSTSQGKPGIQVMKGGDEVSKIRPSE